MGGEIKKKIIFLLGIFFCNFNSTFACIVIGEELGSINPNRERYGYKISGEEVFYGHFIERKIVNKKTVTVVADFQNLRKLENVNAETFKEENQCYGTDKNYIYYQGIKLDKSSGFEIIGSYNANVEYRDGTTEYIKNYIIKNSEHVYDGLEILLLDPKTFKILYLNNKGLVYAQDKTGVYYKGKEKIMDTPVKNGEYSSLENSRHVYLLTKYRVFMETVLIKEADPETFKIFDNDVFLEIAEDKKNFYKNGVKMSKKEREDYFKLNVKKENQEF